MLKKIAIYALLFAAVLSVAQASPVAAAAIQDTNTSAPSGALRDTPVEPKKNAGNTVIINESPTAQKKDWKDWALWGAQVGLAVLGAAGIVVAIYTAQSAKKGAEAALISAKALMSAERAWLSVSPPVWEPGESGNSIQVKVRNVGKTPAKIEKESLEYQLVPDPDKLAREPAYGETAQGEGHFAIPNEEYSLTYKGALTQDQIESLQNGRLFLYAYGFVQYRDAYGRLHETRFGYVYESAEKGGFVHAGPAGYNRVT